MTDRQGRAVQALTVQLMVQSANRYQDLTNFLDDARNAIEDEDSAINAIASVEYAGVTEWSEVVLAADVASKRGMLSFRVEVVYSYRRGLL